jgi:hypothetical protein
MAHGDEHEERLRFLKALAFEIRRKRPPAEAMTDCIESEGRGGRHRRWRQTANTLEADGFVPALLTGGLIGEEAAAVLGPVAEAGDHRLLSAALAALAEHLERQG